MNNISLPSGASLLLSESCNLACKYCFVNTADAFSKKRMTNDVAKKSLEFLCDNALKSGVNSFSVMLFGGEPLLNPDTMEYIFEYGLKLERRNKIKFSACIITNATVMSQRIADIFMEYKNAVNLSCQLSIDGKIESQDLYRITKDGSGSFYMIEKNIPIFKEIFKDIPNSLSIHGCINRQTMSRLFENYKFFHDEWGFKRIWFMPIHDETWTMDDAEEYDRQLGMIYENVISIVRKESTLIEVDNYAPLDRCFNTNDFPSHPCSAGRNFVSITADGDIYPCHQFYFDDPVKTSKLGDVFNGIDEMKRKVFIDYDQNDLCNGCDCNNCYRCIAENFYINGSMTSQIKGIRCQLSKVERKYQLKLKEELKKMGLFKNQNSIYAPGNNPNNPDCLCDSRNSMNSGGECGQESDIKEALKLLLQKVDNIEKMQEITLKKVL